MQNEPTLPYESSIGGALALGERIVWEGNPSLSRARILQANVPYFLVLPAIGVLAAIAALIHLRHVSLAIAAIIGLCLLIPMIYRRTFSVSKREADNTLYRITDRRVIASDLRPGKPHKEQAIAAIRHIETMHGRHPQITISDLELKEAPAVDEMLRHVLQQIARSGRRRRIRRTRMTAAQTIVAAALPVSIALPGDVALAADEKVLWIGRPRVRDPIDREWIKSRATTLAWLVIPVCFILSAAGVLPIFPQAHWFTGAIGALWIFGAVYSITILPIKHARRRARSTYILTSLRAMVHESAKTSITNSYLLDMIGNVSIQRRSDGASDLWLGTARFERLPAEVADNLHATALQAIRAAGGPAEGMIEPDDSPDQT
jgi:hypothetical protein